MKYLRQSKAPWTRAFVVLGLTAGLFLYLSVCYEMRSAVGWLLIFSASCHLMGASELAQGGAVPKWLGLTPAGQALLASGALGLGVLVLEGEHLGRFVAAAIAGLATAAFAIGLRLEGRARVSDRSLRGDSVVR